MKDAVTLDRMLSFPAGRRKKMALVGADHDESLLTVKEYMDAADFLLLGDEAEIRRRCDVLNIPRNSYNIEDIPDHSEAAERGAMLASKGEVDVLMKGGVHTALFTKALLKKERGLVPPEGLISHLALFEIPGLPVPVALSDAALNISPGLNEKKIILENSLAVLRRLKKGPFGVVCVAAVEKVNPKIPGTLDADALASMDWEDARVEGPMGLDAALSAEAAEIKGIESRVAGRPDLLLFPDLNSANAAYKAFSFMKGVRHCGILAGLSLPVVLTSRSDPEEVRSLSLRLALSASFHF
ncbi:MAG: phosphate acyltransferase [Spirochaetales bacterium]|nr:phosphate acyltransferase [Spirochaetales bacterium]